MDLVAAIKRLEFLGQEFLSWLWFVAEREEGVVRPPDGPPVEIEPINQVTLSSGQGQGGFTVACRGRQAAGPEAREALRQGRRVIRAGFLIRTEDAAWQVTLDAATLSLTGVRPVTDPDSGPDESDPLDRLLGIRDLVKIVERLFGMFLDVRLDERWEAEELPALRRWIARD
jgi:hypothetical protein